MRKKLLNERVMKLLDIGSDILVILNAVLILLSVAEYIPSDRVEDIEFFLVHKFVLFHCGGAL